MALFYTEVDRNIKRMRNAIDAISVGNLSGPVGTFSNIDPFVEEYVCEKLDLKPAPISSQIIQRDRYAEYFTTLAIIAASLEKFAVEVRGLQRTEVREAQEYFAAGQKGSSAMPHKKNPITSEQISGLARLLRGNAVAALENVALWHERDISHSSVERIIAPDSTILLDYMLHKTINLFKNIVIYPANMQKNLTLMKDIYYSQTVMLRLIDKGKTREESYAIVQRNAMKVWEKDTNTLQELLLNDSEVAQLLTKQELKNCFNLANLLKNENKIYERLGLL
jgi:adenylosuccinate lyase